MTPSHSADTTTTTVVVGGGLAGLAAATYLARDGAKVTLFEKTPSLGGRAITDTPHGFALNRGAHAFYSGGPASSVLRELGVTYPFGIPNHVGGLDARGLHAFPASPTDMLRTTLFDAADKRDLLRVLFRVGTQHAASLGHQSTADWIAAATRRPRVRAMLASAARVNLYTAALDLASADAFVGRLQQTLTHPVHYIEGGWQTLVDGLHAAAERSGVHIVTSSSAAEIEIRQGRAHAVRLHDGTRLAITSVLVATPPADALHILSADSAPRTHAQLSAFEPVHVACLDLALSRLPSDTYPVVFDLEQPRFLTAQSHFTRLAPNGGAVIHTMLQLDPRHEADPHQQRASLESLMDTLQPGWREVVVEERFLPRLAAVGALPLATTGGLRGRAPHRSEDVANVYFAGDWVGSQGYLVDASLDSARTSARMILGDRQPAQLPQPVRAEKVA